MNKIKQFRMLAIVLPILCILAGGASTYLQYKKLNSAKDDLEVAQKDLAFQRSMLEALGEQPVLAKEPAVQPGPNEQSAFLEGLRQLARETGVQLVKWNNAAAAPAAPPAEGQPAPDVVPMRSSLEVVGSYAAIRNFLYQTQQAPRLLSYSDVKWGREGDAGQTRISLTITRYLSNSAPTSGGAQAAMSAAKEG